ncbi:beta-amylase 2, chloroplastic isoform X1 [Cryptomeria japonica]|uniref:beta-amylase 2, chloroplastic isoform X1 n=1 Tax=Cryptomeria japonica TaxID=3369 RepID=UPI0025AD10AC|nr:beta-amylase 2, chloroplastic isoform X1 [Cryptomeria japonica]
MAERSVHMKAVKHDCDEDCDEEGEGEGAEEQRQGQGQGHHVTAKRRIREREKERERTKLRERQRRAITSRILSGLRQYGNYSLPVRADINDVIAALAREAGWTVDPDGTTYRPLSLSHIPYPPKVAALSSTSLVGSPVSSGSLRSTLVKNSIDFRPSALRLKESFTVKSPVLAMYGEKGQKKEKTINMSIEDSLELMEDEQVQEFLPKEPERDFAGTPFVPVYVMLPLGIINDRCQLVDPEGLRKDLRTLKSINVDGIMVNCWWGIVEGRTPQKYVWSGYRELFDIVQEAKLKLQVSMSFHECGGGNVGDEVHIPLPRWVLEIGRENADIFFTDREGRRNTECLTWGIDKERVLKGRTALEVYFDYMRSFRMEFDDLFVDGAISVIEIGLGASGELRYPSYPERHGWKYPGIGEFQCYDKYLQKSLRKAAEARGHSFWARGPDNAGFYNSQPLDTDFFCDGGDYDSYYGRFFLRWYSQVLIEHCDRVLSFANFAFEGTQIAVKVSGVHLWYKTASHAAELTAGFYNSSNMDGYAPICQLLKKHDATFNFTSVELPNLDRDEGLLDAMEDSQGLVWQVLNASWDAGIRVASVNALPCYDRDSYNRILENAKPRNDPDRRHLVTFTYLRLGPTLMERTYFSEFDRFVKRMHGEAVLHFQQG